MILWTCQHPHDLSWSNFHLQLNFIRAVNSHELLASITVSHLYRKDKVVVTPRKIFNAEKYACGKQFSLKLVLKQHFFITKGFILKKQCFFLLDIMVAFRSRLSYWPVSIIQIHSPVDCLLGEPIKVPSDLCPIS